MASPTDSYFIAIVPPEPIYAQALGLKEYFKDKYQSSASLRSPPHITLHMPFDWKKEKEGTLVDALAPFGASLAPVRVVLKNFESFPPRVIFIDVVLSDELSRLQNLVKKFCRQELNLFNADYKDIPFRPHLTIAFRDLKKSIFKTAWEEFRSKEFQGEFYAEQISLLKHDGKRWNVLRSFPLSG